MGRQGRPSLAEGFDGDADVAAAFDHLVDEAPFEVLSKSDSTYLTVAAVALVEYRRVVEIARRSSPILRSARQSETAEVVRNPAHVEARRWSEHLLRLLGEGGFTPSARRSLGVPLSVAMSDDRDRLLS